MNDKEHQRHRLIYHTNGKSLEEINGTVEVPSLLSHEGKDKQAYERRGKNYPGAS